MTPAELRRVLDRAGLSQRGAARELDLNERTVRKYVAGRIPIPLTVELALKWVLEHRAVEAR